MIYVLSKIIQVPHLGKQGAKDAESLPAECLHSASGNQLVGDNEDKPGDVRCP